MYLRNHLIVVLLILFESNKLSHCAPPQENGTHSQFLMMPIEGSTIRRAIITRSVVSDMETHPDNPVTEDTISGTQVDQQERNVAFTDGGDTEGKEVQVASIVDAAETKGNVEDASISKSNVKNDVAKKNGDVEDVSISEPNVANDDSKNLPVTLLSQGTPLETYQSAAQKETIWNVEQTSPEPDDELSGRSSIDKSDLEEATAIPQLYGAGTLLRPVQNYESERTQDAEELNEDAGFVTENPEYLKSNVFTSVLEAEVITDPFECTGSRGPLRNMAAESKYFVDRSRLYNFLEARDICEKYNLVIAEVEEVADHRTIDRFMKAGDYHEIKGSSMGSRFFIGLNDVKTEGVFMYANGKNITYQNFLASQPDDKDGAEDCATIMKESRDGPSGAADYDCKKPAHVICMFHIDTQCYNESKETIENRKLASERKLHLLVNATERGYFVSNYQATWRNAMKECDNKQMKLFDMDGLVTMGFFRSIVRWESRFFRIPMPTVQYWTSGKLKKSHMTAPIIWRTNPDPTESEERGVEKQNATFSFSGIFHWSTKKKADPGGPHGWRRDLCVSFGMDNSPNEIPFVRNTNCDLPTYFICYVEYPDDVGDEEGTSIEETTDPEPVNPDDAYLSRPHPVSEAEIAEIENMMDKKGRSRNITCSTKVDNTAVGQNGLVGARYQWRNGFYVYIDGSYSKDYRKLINAAMYELQQHLCIPFWIYTQSPRGNYVHIRNRGECSAHVGKVGGSQDMSLGDHCQYKGRILHQMVHALGFWHEQNRPDRNQYVNIHWSNIKQGLQSNFAKFDGTNTYGVAYNTKSIMHYNSNDFSSNGKPTISAKNGGPVGSQNVLQQSDIQKLRNMYNCK